MIGVQMEQGRSNSRHNSRKAYSRNKGEKNNKAIIFSALQELNQLKVIID